MTDIPAIPRLALPLPAVAQAQKEVTHNEALTLLDSLVHTVVEAGRSLRRPLAPVSGNAGSSMPSRQANGKGRTIRSRSAPQIGGTLRRRMSVCA